LFGPSTVDVGSSADHSVTYLVTPSYNFDDHNMVYLRVASGYRPGGPTGVAPSLLSGGAPETYKPDSLTNYEVGYKASFPEQRMTIDVSVFDIEWKNIQILSQINGFNVTGNGAAARSAGLEFAWTWRPISGLNLSANGAYTDAYMTGPDPADAVHTGDRLPYVPKWAGNVSADYDFPVANDLSGFVGGNSNIQGLKFGITFQVCRQHIPDLLIPPTARLICIRA
jgi:outer membrane receptor protein involved in Fe transport